ncbi:MAG: hypothetical protein COA42_14435 [Alteromonadaceae bacterium]|nr:MAG: hypothetical protein COA42_14435 [Alteromonadaceae bacterium]
MSSRFLPVKQALSLTRFHIARALSISLTINLSISLGMSLSSNSYSGETSGYIGAELRYFPSTGLIDSQKKFNASASGYLEYTHDYAEGEQRIGATLFARADSTDAERSHEDIRELYWWKNFGSFELYAGVRKVFWGVTESVHLVDILNQSDTLENIDNEDKMGQAMIQLVRPSDWGTFSAFVLPYFREREFPGSDGRLRASIPISQDAHYQSGAEQQHVDYALRWSHYIGVWDIGLSYFSGTNRAPVLLPEISQEQTLFLRPHYQQISQAGLDLQATIDAWLLKLEAIHVDERNHGSNTALVTGFEYTLYNLWDRNHDLGLVLEYQLDDRTGSRQNISQNDLVMGARWAFNDVNGSELLALASQDLDSSNRFFSVEAKRRINDDWKLSLEARMFSAIEIDTIEFDLRKDHYLQLELRRYF